MGLWREILHPRDSKGRFVRKASVGVRVSTRSASVTVGKRYPIVPGKLNVYGGVLLRVERANVTSGPIDRLIDSATSRAVSAVPEGTLRNIASSLASGQSHRLGSTLITANGLRPQQPTLRVTRSSVPQRAQNSDPSYTKNSSDRAPRRKPRARSAARPGGHSQTTNEPSYSSIVGQQEARGREARTGTGDGRFRAQKPVVNSPRDGVVTVTRTVGRTRADSELSAEELLFRRKARRGDLVAKAPSTKKVKK